MANETIKREAKKARVPLWKIAEQLEITPTTLSVWFRHELSRERQREIFEIIEQLKQEA